MDSCNCRVLFSMLDFCFANTEGLKAPYNGQLHKTIGLYVAPDQRMHVQDARMPTPRLQSMYTEMVVLIRKLYQVCRLVHGDLSEYNILVNEVSPLPLSRKTRTSLGLQNAGSMVHL